MQVQQKAKNLKLTPAIVSYLEKRLEPAGKLIRIGSTVRCDVELAKTTAHHEKGLVYYAEINLQVNGVMYRATAEAETIETAIDEMQSNVMRELKKNKKKTIQTARKTGAKAKEFLRKGGKK